MFLQEKECDEAGASRDACEANDDVRSVTSSVTSAMTSALNDDAPTAQALAERRVTRSTLRQQQSKCTL